eukprot:NODE_395_length_8134_cov_0.767393.p4 type:complete len:235 gc:universal NODE_395_length_8134_cov_0.767393:3272-3976(+)
MVFKRDIPKCTMILTTLLFATLELGQLDATLKRVPALARLIETCQSEEKYGSFNCAPATFNSLMLSMEDIAALITESYKVDKDVSAVDVTAVTVEAEAYLYNQGYLIQPCKTAKSSTMMLKKRGKFCRTVPDVTLVLVAAAAIVFNFIKNVEGVHISEQVSKYLLLGAAGLLALRSTIGVYRTWTAVEIERDSSSRTRLTETRRIPEPRKKEAAKDSSKGEVKTGTKFQREVDV